MNQNFKQLSSELENILSPKSKQKQVEEKMITQHIATTELKDLWKAFEQAKNQLCAGFHFVPFRTEDVSVKEAELREQVSRLFPGVWNATETGIYRCEAHCMFCLVMGREAGKKASYHIGNDPTSFVDFCAEVDLTFRPRVTVRDISHTSL